MAYKEINDILKNSKLQHPLYSAFCNNDKYYKDFLNILEDYKRVLNDNEYNKFLLKGKLDKSIEPAEYLQFAAEVTVVDYIIRTQKCFINEPIYNKKKNPECSFEYDNRIVNIEVKCPNLSKRITQEKLGDVRIYAGERFPDIIRYNDIIDDIEHNCDSITIQPIDRLDNKLKDYLISAHNKFPNTSEKYFNILIIALDIISDMDEWYSYLFGDYGAFTCNTYIKEDYSNVDAVMITNIQSGHVGNPEYYAINCWALENYLSLIFLDPRKEKKHNLGRYFFESGGTLFGSNTFEFIKFQERLDDLDKNVDLIRNDNTNQNYVDEDKYIYKKILSMQMISEWVNEMKTNNCKRHDN